MSTAPPPAIESLISGMVESGEKLEPSQLNKIAEALSQTFSVRSDEVAILSVTPDNRFLRFCAPQGLQGIGKIPLMSNSALAARTAREKRSDIINRFVIVPHASVFEGVRLNEQFGDPIQKIMSVPVSHLEKLVGVLQVSRKSKTARGALEFLPGTYSGLWPSPRFSDR